MQCYEATTGVIGVLAAVLWDHGVPGTLYAVWCGHYWSGRSLVCGVATTEWLEPCMQCGEATTGVAGVCMQCGEATTGVTGVLYAVT